jgi:hypothetical protein
MTKPRKVSAARQTRRRVADVWDHLSKGAKIVTVLGGAVAAVGAIVGGYFAFVSQFALAGDVNTLSSKVDRYALQSELQWMEHRRSAVADKVYDMRARPKLTPAERASLLRYEGDLDQLNRAVRDKQRELAAIKK